MVFLTPDSMSNKAFQPKFSNLSDVNEELFIELKPTFSKFEGQVYITFELDNFAKTSANSRIDTIELQLEILYA